MFLFFVYFLNFFFGQFLLKYFCFNWLTFFIFYFVFWDGFCGFHPFFTVWLGTTICRVLSVGQHAVSVCHGSVCSVGSVFLL